MKSTVNPNKTAIGILLLLFAFGASSFCKAATSFDSLCDEFIDAYYKTNPSGATSAGVHQYDGEIEDYSAAATTARLAELRKFLERFQAVDPKSLPLEASLDRDLVISAIQSEIHEKDTLRRWQMNPDMYSSGASNTVYVIMSRRFASPEERMKSVISRERKIPAMLQVGRANLKNPPKIFTEVALEQLPGIIGFFKTDVPSAFLDVKDAQILADFKTSNEAVIKALGDYETYLKKKVLPKSKGNFQLGEANFMKKLLYDDMVDMPVNELLDIGWKNLRANQKLMKETAFKIDPKRKAEDILTDLEKDHPKPENLLNSVRGLLGGLRKFINEKQIVTIPSQIEPIVEETPPFERALTFASMDTPGPFETVAKEAYYNITLPEKDWSPEKVEEHMTGYNHGVLISTSIHEAYPGHYIQFLWLDKAPSKVRKLFGANSNVEGWAHYTEQMMLEEGFGGNDPKVRLGQISDALLRNGRFIVGIQMHRGKMTFKQGIDFFMKESRLSKANAERETKRGTMDPTYLYYTLGKLEIYKLREDYKKMKGDKFSLREFHDSFLKEGFPPIKLVRKALLGNDSPVL